MADNNQISKSVATVALISLLVGGVAGGAVGAVTGGIASDYIVPWFEETFLGQESENASDDDVDDKADEGKVTTVTREEESDTINTVSQVIPAVGSIIVRQNLDQLLDLTRPTPFELFFGLPSQQPQGEQEVSAGTGFIISSDGYILTNKHVIDVTEAQYTFITNDGNQYDAELVDVDPFNDMAVMKIEASDLPFVKLGDSDGLVLGQTVIAIGNTLSQFPNTVTKGIVSGQGRTIIAGDGRGQSETIEEVIQTDAAINSGNSGGPLINLSGEVVGINTAVSQEGQLIGFAIPINIVKLAIDSVQASGRIVRPYLGIRYTMITSELAEANNLARDYGALLVRGSSNELAVIPDGPADQAGLEENDIILEINNQRLDEKNTLSKFMRRAKVNDEISLKIYRDGSEKTLKATLEEYPD